MTNCETFKAQIVKGRITIPEEIRERLGIWEYDWVKVTIEKEEKGGEQSA